MTDLELGRLLLSLVLLLTMALGCGRLFERLAMPRVVGEIAGGLVLGPSALGLAFPHLHAWLFRAFPSQDALLSAFYWMGLILLMFVAGFRLERGLASPDRRIVAVVLASSLVVPMAGGWHLTALIEPARLMAPGADPLAFHLVLAIATAVTSIPVISRIFIELGLMGTRFAKIVLTSATLQDLVLWTALAVATGLNAGREAERPGAGAIAATTIAFVGLSLALGPPLLAWIGRRLSPGRDAPALVGYALLVCFALAAAASLLDVNVVFGALVAGIVVGTLPHDRLVGVKDRISDVALWFFVPLYFALVGLAIDLPNAFDAYGAAVFLLASSALKFGSVALGLRLAGTSAATAVAYGVAMNVRGGPGIVLASVALAFGIVTESFFVTLVLTSVATSLAGGAWLRRWARNGAALDR